MTCTTLYKTIYKICDTLSRLLNSKYLERLNKIKGKLCCFYINFEKNSDNLYTTVKFPKWMFSNSRQMYLENTFQFPNSNYDCMFLPLNRIAYTFD